MATPSQCKATLISRTSEMGQTSEVQNRLSYTCPHSMCLASSSIWIYDDQQCTGAMSETFQCGPGQGNPLFHQLQVLHLNQRTGRLFSAVNNPKNQLSQDQTTEFYITYRSLLQSCGHATIGHE